MLKAYKILFVVFLILNVGTSWLNNFSLIEELGLFVFLSELTRLLFLYGEIIPIRALVGTLMGLQMIVGPLIAYSGNDDFLIEVYRMSVSPNEYYTYAVPAYVLFLLGLNLLSSSSQGEKINIDVIKYYNRLNKNISYLFILVGFLASFMQAIVPSSLAFYMYLFGGFKFVGVFLIILGGEKLKPLPLFTVYGSIILSSLGQGMFHDLLTWLIFLGAVYAIKYKPSLPIKLSGALVFCFLGVIIQLIKSDYRSAEFGVGASGFYETAKNISNLAESKKIILLKENAVRINQGFILSKAMNNVPSQVPFAEGKTMKQIFASAILPRFLYKDKLNAGDQKIFMKYTGMMLNKTTSMGLGSMTDAYVNFGVIGGVFFMFIYGGILNLILVLLYRVSHSFPVILLFTPLIFLYAIRPDCEMQTLLGHLFKSMFLLAFVFSIFKKNFFFPETKTGKYKLLSI